MPLWWNLYLLVMAAGWTFAYVVIIWRGFVDKTSGMPLICLWLNICWEGLMAFWVRPDNVMLYICIIWFLFDVVILVQKFMYGKEEFRNDLPHVSTKWFLPFMLTVGVFAFSFDLRSMIEWDDWRMAQYSAVLMNIVMSYLFVLMLLRRGNTKGQSLWVAWGKMIGSLMGYMQFGFVAAISANSLPAGMFFRYPNSSVASSGSILVGILGLGCLVADIAYTVLLTKAFHREGISGWTQRPVHTDKVFPLAADGSKVGTGVFDGTPVAQAAL